ncbi:methyltransferase domain-containing protein [Mycobacterium ahvazicum]|uniref:Methyltransferase domain-containing protein n=1 Tax=Mycobacterium ahvazicum TaxID=1964395 RepID=A0A2K4Y7V2_9MYCO|nr:methyltransferase domain-containing protein [Mycobacterium ahvazicum]SOX52863.1 methyltransferase domain-containing protein [Mycobacterium ahvazicum]
MTAAAKADRIGEESKHRAVWALGDYSAVAAAVAAPLGPILVQASGIGVGDRVLDVAAGSGNVAIPAAESGADVVASDLCPDLLDRGQAIARTRGIELQWLEANAEALPCDSDGFDAVLSCVGVMFAPRHQRAADELVRVCRPGGTIGLISWTPEGFVGAMFATMQPYVAAPPPGAQPATMWGDTDYVRALLSDRVVEFSAQRRVLQVDCFADGAAFRDFFKANYGPTLAAYRGIADEPERVAALDTQLAELGSRYLVGSSKMEWEYLLVTARKR